MRRLAVMLAAGFALAASPAAHAASGDFYLALGDSLAAGTQSQPASPTGGYTVRLTAAMQAVDPGLTLMNIACGGATTTSLISTPCHGGSGGTQLQQAEAFLTANRGHVPLVTIDIGGNDVAGCLQGSAYSSSCIAAGMAAIDRNVPQIVAGLKAAAGPETRFAMMTYYDPFLELWVKGGNGQSLAQQSVPLVDALNAKLIQDFGPGFVDADVSRAFSTDDMTTLVSTPNHGVLPKDVAVICQLTGGCDYSFNVHANVYGHQLIADTFFAALQAASAPPTTPPQTPPAIPPAAPLAPAQLRSPLLYALSVRHLRAPGKLRLRFRLTAAADVSVRITRVCRPRRACHPRTLVLRGHAGVNTHVLRAARGRYSVHATVGAGPVSRTRFRVR